MGVRENAIQYFDNGFHCAESAVAALLDELDEGAVDKTQAIKSIAAFGGGVGKSHLELCGALSGALLVLGVLHGRGEQGMDWDYVADVGVSLRERFVAIAHSSICGDIRDRFGEQENMDKCKAMTGEFCEAALTLLQEAFPARASTT